MADTSAKAAPLSDTDLAALLHDAGAEDRERAAHEARAAHMSDATCPRYDDHYDYATDVCPELARLREVAGAATAEQRRVEGTGLVARLRAALQQVVQERDEARAVSKRRGTLLETLGHYCDDCSQCGRCHACEGPGPSFVAGEVPRG